MIKITDIEHRFMDKINEIEKQTASIKKMINRDFLSSVSYDNDMDIGLCWLEDLQEILKMLKTVEESMFFQQASSDNYPLEEESSF